MSKQQKNRHSDGDERYTQPLLGEDSHRNDNGALFAIDDDSDEDTALTTPRRPHEHSVRFQAAVQVIAPPLRSTYSSREAGGICCYSN